MTYIFHDSQHQQGFSLVEIMVAMALGLVLLGGTITIYSSSKNSYRLQENIAGLQENARFAIHALRRDVEVAGYPLIRNIVPFNAALTLDGGGNNSDQITTQYRSDAQFNTDCLGAFVAAGNLVINRYSIDANNNLRCQGNSGTQTLVENVNNLQALYGIDTDLDGTANLYATATEVNLGTVNAGAPDWGRVVSLRLALLVRSDSTLDQAQQQTYTLLDAPAINMNDGVIYRVFTTTIPLRNRIQ